MGTDQRILGYLGRALSLELSAVQTYSTQARLAAGWGFDGPAARLRKMAQEAVDRSDRVIARMLALGVAPAASQLRPAIVAGDLLGLLRADHEFERERAQLLGDATSHCAKSGNSDDRVFFGDLAGQQAEQLAQLAGWIAELAPTGPNREDWGARL